jgi:hypothetical protein
VQQFGLLKEIKGACINALGMLKTNNDNEWK